MTRFVLLLLAFTLLACGESGTSDPGANDAIEDLGALDAKADGVVLRKVELTVAPNSIRRFRIRTAGFRAAFDQSGAGMAQLTATHYDIDVDGKPSAQPELEATADDTVRNWTLRVVNLSDAPLTGSLLVTEWTPAESEPPFVGELGDLLREEAVAVEPGDTKTFRVRAPRFHAGLTQAGDVSAQLSVKHFDIELEGEAGPAPTVQAIANVDAVRNWTLRVQNLGDELLEGTLKVHALVGQPTVELGIISDIDKTIMPPETAAGLTPPYPGIAAILNALDLREGGQRGDVFFVTARNPSRVVEVPEYFKMYDVPEGPISTGISGAPWIAQAEKVRDISAILDAHPDQRFVLFGDSSHRDPDAYREIIALYPGRIVSAYIHKVKGINEQRRQGLFIHEGYGEVTASLFGLGLLSESDAERIMDEVVAGTELTVEAGKALLDAQRAE